MAVVEFSETELSERDHVQDSSTGLRLKMLGGGR